MTSMTCKYILMSVSADMNNSENSDFLCHRKDIVLDREKRPYCKADEKSNHNPTCPILSNGAFVVP